MPVKKENANALLGLAVGAGAVYLLTRDVAGEGGGLVLPPPEDITPPSDPTPTVTVFESRYRVALATSPQGEVTVFESRYRVASAPNPLGEVTVFESRYRVALAA